MQHEVMMMENKQSPHSPMFFSVQSATPSPKMKVSSSSGHASPSGKSPGGKKKMVRRSSKGPATVEFIDADGLTTKSSKTKEPKSPSGKKTVKVKKVKKKKKETDLDESNNSFGVGDFDQQDDGDPTSGEASISHLNLHHSFTVPTRTSSSSQRKVRSSKEGGMQALHSSSPAMSISLGRKAGAGTPGRKLITMQPSMKTNGTTTMMVKQKSGKSTLAANAKSMDDFQQDAGELDWFFPESTMKSSSKKDPNNQQSFKEVMSKSAGDFGGFKSPSSPKKPTISAESLMNGEISSSPKVKKVRSKSSRRSSMVGRVELSNDESAADLAKTVKEESKKSRRRSYAGKEKKSKSGHKRRSSGGARTSSGSSEKLKDIAASNIASTTRARKPPRDLFAILDFEPWSSDNTSYSNEELMDAIEADPESVKKKYRFEFFGVVIYPFSMMCALGCSLEALRMCYQVFPEAMHEKDPWVGSPLHYACGYEGSSKVVDWLLEKDPEMVNTINRLKRTPFHIACQFNPRKKILQSLLRVDPSGFEARDKYGYMPMHLSCENNAPLEVLELMMEIYSMACLAVSHTGATPLHMALENRVHLNKIKILVKAHESVLEIRDLEGRCPLHKAVENECEAKIVKYLVKHNPKTLSCKTDWLDETPLEMAKRLEADAEVISLLKQAQ